MPRERRAKSTLTTRHKRARPRAGWPDDALETGFRRSREARQEPTRQGHLAPERDEAYEAVLRDIRACDEAKKAGKSWSLSNAPLPKAIVTPATITFAQSRAQIKEAIDAHVAAHRWQERVFVAKLYRAGVERRILQTARQTIDQRLEELQRRRIAILREHGMLPAAPE